MVADTSALVAVLQETDGSAFEQKLLHPARLNFGDCFSYALAKQLGEPLLFKGNDFVHTDVLKA